MFKDVFLLIYSNHLDNSVFVEIKRVWKRIFCKFDISIVNLILIGGYPQAILCNGIFFPQKSNYLK